MLTLFFKKSEVWGRGKKTHVGDVEVPVLIRKAPENVSSGHEESASEEDGSGAKLVDEEDDGRTTDKE